MSAPYVAPFTLDEAQRAADAWGANCGPGALAAILDLSLEAVRPHLTGFEQKRYTNPTMMLGALASLQVRWRRLSAVPAAWPSNGLCRVQWEGPWTAPGVPIAARYRHTHWIASRFHEPSSSWWVFDINAICVGGWVPYHTWRDKLVPWLLKECQPKANGRWHLTHRLQIVSEVGT